MPLPHLDPVRVSIILPGVIQRAWCEAWVHEILRAFSELGEEANSFEVIVVDAQTPSRIGDHIESCFRDARLRVERVPKTRDLGLIRNLGIQKARGHTLAFINPWDQPKASRTGLDSDGGLAALFKVWLQNLKSHDLFLVTAPQDVEPDAQNFAQSHTQSHGESNKRLSTLALRSDVLLKLILEDHVWTSGSWIKRALYDRVGGFENSTLLLEEYAFWLKALTLLDGDNELKRVAAAPDHRWIQHKNPWSAQIEGMSLPLSDHFFEKAFALRARATLVSCLRFLPKKHWKQLASRITGFKPKVL